MTRLVIFDLDGTLLNTLDDLADSANHVLKEHGFPVHTLEQYKYFVGNGVYKLVERMTPEEHRGDAALIERLKSEFDEYYSAHNEDKTAPYDGVLELLDALRERGILLAVLSNKPHVFTQALCGRMFGDRFALVLGNRPGYPCKPDPMLVREVLSTLHVQPSQCLYVGDSGVDMQTAKSGGLFGVGVLWGFRSREELLENGASALIDRPMDLLQFVR